MAGSRLLSPSVLRIFVCFAVGGLLGDAFLHLIPHAINPHSHSDAASPAAAFVSYLTTLVPASVSRIVQPQQPAASLSSPSSPFSSPAFTASDLHDADHDSHHGSQSHHSHEHGHDDDIDARGQRAGLLVLSGMLLFFVIEKVARLRVAAGGSSHAGHSHSHGGDSGRQRSRGRERELGALGVAGVVELDDADGSNGPAATVLRRRRGKDGVMRSSLSPSPSPSPPPSRQHPAPSPTSTSASSSQASPFRLVALLNLIADVSHNFTDGLAISASFLSSPAVGLSTTLAVLLHELPHELGDAAILLQAGYSVQQAMGFQLLTALGALLGVAVVAVGGAGGGVGSMDWVLPVTAGGFIYVALANVVPGVLTGADDERRLHEHGQDEEHKVAVYQQAAQAVCEVAALCVGVGLMTLIGLLE